MAPYTTSTISAASSQTAMDLSCDSQTPMVAASSSRPVSVSKQARSAKLAPAPNPVLMSSEIDNFFGGPAAVKKPKPAATKKSSRGKDEMYTHQRGSSQGTLAPPPYEVPAHLAPTPKPMTIAKHLFKFGFLFPPFWVIGACILWSPLRVDPAPNSNPEPSSSLQKDIEAGYASVAQAEVAVARKTELVYARRCLIAAITFVMLVIIVIVATRVARVGAFAPRPHPYT
ncbi:hypothetical protein FRC07_007613 [Ceratobasidium sp. 392]|nr:hypothetical protein FRC07_007613 [Ceratobasidium sp. 392]